MSGRNIARKIQRRLWKGGQLSDKHYQALRRPQPSRPGQRYHPTKGFRKERA